MLLLFVGLSIEAREGRNSKSTVPESLLVRSRAIRIGNPRVGRPDYIRVRGKPSPSALSEFVVDATRHLK
jgi:hypothetical protein